MKRAAESERNMVASPHAKTSRRRGPKAALTLLDKAADILIKLSRTLLHKNLASTNAVFVGMEN